MKPNKGFTLIEMAVVLAIIAILAAILTPIVTGYIDQARNVRASEDVAKIAQAYLLHYRDTGRFPVWNTTTTAGTGTTPDVNCQVSGTSAAIPSAAAGAVNTSWNTTAPNCSANVGLITVYLNINTLGVQTSSQNAGQVMYRGPYLDGLSNADPWGQPYVVTSSWLASSGAQAVNWAFVISAGPNGTLDTNRIQIARGAGAVVFAAGGDDLTALIH